MNMQKPLNLTKHFMKIRLTDMNVEITNSGTGSTFWTIKIGEAIYHFERQHDNKWLLSRLGGNGYFDALSTFTCRDSMKAIQRGIKEAFIYGGVLA